MGVEFHEHQGASAAEALAHIAEGAGWGVAAAELAQRWAPEDLDEDLAGGSDETDGSDEDQAPRP